MILGNNLALIKQSSALGCKKITRTQANREEIREQETNKTKDGGEKKYEEQDKNKRT